MTDEEKAKDLTSKSFELEKDKVEWFCSTYKNSRMSEIHTFYNGVLVGLAEGRKEGYEQGILKDCIKVACSNCKPSADNYCIDCEYANLIIDKDNQISQLEKEKCELLGIIQGKDEIIAELKECITKYNKHNMICFAADMVYKALNPKSSMNTPNCVYIKMESELENWS